MVTIEITTGDAVEMVRAIRDKNYEEMKYMTTDEKMECRKKKSDAFLRLMKEVNPNDYDFSFLKERTK